MPTQHDRDYGTNHRRLRKAWQARVLSGTVLCARCHRLIPAGAPWDLGHDDHDRGRYSGPEHRRCNRGTAGRFRPKVVSRRW